MVGPSSTREKHRISTPLNPMMILSPIKRRRNQTKDRKNESAKVDPSEDVRTYVIDPLSIGESANDSESNSE